MINNVGSETKVQPDNINFVRYIKDDLTRFGFTEIEIERVIQDNENNLNNISNIISEHVKKYDIVKKATVKVKEELENLLSTEKKK